MRKRYLLILVTALCELARADQNLVQQIRDTGLASKVHPMLLEKLTTVAPTERVVVWIQLRDRPPYDITELPARGYLPPVYEDYMASVKNLPGARLLGVSELTNELSAELPAAAILEAITNPYFDFIEESPPLQREKSQRGASHPAFSPYQGVSYDAIQVRPLQEATWGGYFWDSTGANKHKRIAVLDTGIWPFSPAFWTSEKPLPASFGDTSHTAPISIAARGRWVHLLPKRSNDFTKLFYMRSSDYGLAWDTARVIAEVDSESIIEDFKIAAASDGVGDHVIALYLRWWPDTSGVRKSVYVVVSNDNGNTWTTPMELYVTPQWVSPTFFSFLDHIALAAATDGATSWAYALWDERTTTYPPGGGPATQSGQVRVRRSSSLMTNDWMPAETILGETKPPVCVGENCFDYFYGFSELDASAEGTTAHTTFHRYFARSDLLDAESKLFLYTGTGNGATWTQSLGIVRTTTGEPLKPAYPSVATKDGFGHVAFWEDSLVYYTRHPSPPAAPVSLSNAEKVFQTPAIAVTRDTASFSAYRRVVHVAWFDHRGDTISVRYKRHPNNGDAGTPWDDGDTFAGNDNEDVSRRLSMDFASTFWKPSLDMASMDETATKIPLVHLAWRETRSVDNKKYPWYANSSKVYAWRDFGTNVPKPRDFSDHGSGVSSVAAACIVERTHANAGFNPFMGTAYNAVLALAVDNNQAETIQAIKWAVDTINADVINFSAGYGGADSGANRVAQYADWAVARGVVFTKSAGNNGPGGGTITAPGDNFNALTVGGSLRSGTSIMPISSRGPVLGGRIKPDIVAPGGNGNGAHHENAPIVGPGGDIYTADPDPNTAGNRLYDWWEGTSFSAPHAAGVAAMLLQSHPDWTPGAVRKALASAASAVGGAALPNNNQGWGLMQAGAANGINPAPFPPSILPSASDFQDSAARGGNARLRILVKPNGGVDTAKASLAAFGVTGTLSLVDSGVIGAGWHVYAADYAVPATTPVGMKHIKVSAYRNGAGVHDTARAYINLYIKMQLVDVRERPPSDLPKMYALHQNYPNPFNPATTIRYALPKPGWVKLDIYNILGERLAVVVDEWKLPGIHQVEWNAENLASGIYFYRLQAGNFVGTRKLLLLK